MNDTHFVLPRTFQPANVLSGKLILRADDARWLVSTIVRKTATKQIDLWGCVRLHSDILRRVMDPRDYPKIIGALVDAGVIEKLGYCAGVKSTGYRLAARYLGDRCVRVPITDPRLRMRLECERERLNNESGRPWKPIHFALNQQQQTITLDDSVDTLVEALPAHTRLCQDVLVANIRDRRYPFTIGSTGRVFNSITGLKRELRAALRFNREPIAAVDIKNAQPGLLAFLLNRLPPSSGCKSRSTYKHTRSRGSVAPAPVVCSVPLLLPADMLGSDAFGFARFVADGSFYERLQQKTALSREVVKKRFLVDVLAKQGKYPSEVEAAFAQMFPTVYRAIRTINGNDHSTLIRLLQEAESWLVVENVALAVLKRGINAQTLHDSIFAPAKQIKTVAEVFAQELAKLDCELTTKIEGCE